MKTCRTCKKARTQDDFYKDRTRPDGLRTQCKSCDNSRRKVQYRNNKEWELHRQSLHNQRADVKEKTRLRRVAVQQADPTAAKAQRKAYYDRHKQQIQLRQADYRLKHPQIINAYSALRTARRKGEAPSLPSGQMCVDCRLKPAVHGHHEDYDKPLEVDWLCTSCHKLRHTRQMPDTF